MGFASCHPAINFLYFACVIGVTLSVPHPVFLGIGLVCAYAYSIRLTRWRGGIFGVALIPLVLAFAVYYCSSHHFGVTVLYQNFIENNMTLEAAVYALVLGGMAATAMIWFSCVHAIFTADKVVYLFGRVSPRLSLFLAILLRMVPRIKTQARKIHTARQGIGRGIHQGNLLNRLRNAIGILSILITWCIETMAGISESMRSRGSGLRGRTAYSIYRFDNRDRAYVIGVSASMTLLIMGLLLRQGHIRYDPIIRMNPITPMSFLFYGGYLVFCLMPLVLDTVTEIKFRRARRSI